MSYTRPKLSKGRLGDVPFQYNPAEFLDGIGVNWSEIGGAGSSYPIDVYSGGKARRITFTFYLNDVEKPGELRKMINNLHSYIPPARRVGYQFVSPKPVIFSLGWFVKECLLEDAQIKYTMFTPELEPLEAQVDVTLKLIQ